nr:MAG TPA: hypothetical protein [Caudoviricetes sp.]
MVNLYDFFAKSNNKAIGNNIIANSIMLILLVIFRLTN